MGIGLEAGIGLEVGIVGIDRTGLAGRCRIVRDRTDSLVVAR